MLQQLFFRLFGRRHFWRTVTFGEVGALYASRLLRMTAHNMMALFVALFLFKQGYSLLFIALYYAAFFAYKTCFAFLAGKYAAQFGPKHGILTANLLNIPSLIAFSLLDVCGITALVVYSVFQGASVSLYGICHLIDFSKVKNVQHAGKEIGFMNIAEKIAATASPLIGGVIAWQFGPVVTMWFAAFLFAVAALPLLRTGEQIKTKQPFSYKGFPWRTTWRSFVAESGFGSESFVIVMAWPIFLSLAVFVGSGEEIYAELGVLASITVIVSFVVSYVYGKLIDGRRGRELLNYSIVLNALVNASRPFVTTPYAAGATNIVHETASIGASMAFIRGMFDLADRSGHRVVYLTLIEVCINVGSLICSLVLALLLAVVQSDVLALQLFFAFAALYVLIVATPRFPLYSHK